MEFLVQKKTILAPKPKIRDRGIQTVVHEHFKPRIKRHTRREKRANESAAEVCYDRGLEFEASLETRVHASCPFFCCLLSCTHKLTFHVVLQNSLLIRHYCKAMNSAWLHPCSTRELDVQRRFKSTAMAAQADKLRNHIQIISEMTEDELQHLQKCVGYKLPIVGSIYLNLNYPFQLHGMTPRPLWKLAISIHAPCFERSVFYSRDNVKNRDLY